MSLRVVIVTRISPVLAAFDAVVRGTGHEPVAFLTMRNVDGRYGPPPDTFYPEFGPTVGEALAEALERLAAGDEGTPQPEGGGYESFFSEEDAWLDVSRLATEVHRLAWSWRYAISLGGTRGALLELDGRTVRVLATSLAEVEGAQRLDCGDGPLWIVETEELSEEEARPSTDPAPSTQ